MTSASLRPRSRPATPGRLALLAILALAACGSRGALAGGGGGSTVPTGGPPTAVGPTTVGPVPGVDPTTDRTTDRTTDPTTAPVVTGPDPAAHAVDPVAAAALASARARWAAAHLDPYGFQVSVGCFCRDRGPWNLRVSAGVPATVPTNGPEPVAGGPPATLATVPGMFAEIERALAGADSVTVTYDPLLGYPVAVAIDWITRAVDDELSWRVSSLHAA